MPYSRMPEAKHCPKVLKDSDKCSQTAVPQIHSVQETDLEPELFSCLSFSLHRDCKESR